MVTWWNQIQEIMTHLIKNVKKNVRVNLDKYVNYETGELLLSELKDSASIVTKMSTNLVEIRPDDYFTTNSDALKYLFKHLNRQEIGAVMFMAMDLQTDQNLVYNGTVPHTNYTLRKSLGIKSTSTYALLMQKLMDLNVLHQSKDRVQGMVRVIYSMNPFLVKKRKTLDHQLLKVFSELRSA